MNSGKWVKGVIIGIVAALLLAILNPFVVVGANERGLKFRFGAVQDRVLMPGLSMKLPVVDSVRKISLLPHEIDYDIKVGPDGAITRDNQIIGAHVLCYYRYKPSPDQLIKMWKEYGTEKTQTMVQSAVVQATKVAVGQYTIFDVPMNQDQIITNTMLAMGKILSEVPVEVQTIRITNYDWNPDFDKQINLTMEKTQQVKQKEQDLTMANLEAQKSVKQAEANKQATILAAEAERDRSRLEAEARVLEGEGIRKYNQSIAVNWDIELKKKQLEIEMKKAERWNGAYVPNNMYGPIPVSAGGIQGQ